jgi:hypothetical protein
MNDRMTSPDNTSNWSPEQRLFASFDIPDMERRGQQQLVASIVLPAAMDGDDAPFEALGFTFGEQVPGDPLFRQATLPEGWTKRGTDHDMHSVIEDERGIARVGVFYKAAYYDRRADMSLMNVGYRFATEWIYGDETPEFNPLFTDQELLDIHASVSRSRTEIEECPQVYAKNTPRVESLDAAVKAKLAERGVDPE